MEKNKTLSVVVPAFNEENNVSELYRVMRESLPKLGMQWEVLFVDDGSTDGTWQEIIALNKSDNRVKGARFSRNFGHQYAIFAGLAKAGGDAVITMDADLQHPVQVIPLLVEEWKKGNKIVHTIRIDEKGMNVIKKLTSSLFYKIYNFLCGVRMEGGMADFRLLDRQVVNDILKVKEEGLFMRGLVQWAGYQSSKVKYQCAKRMSGKPKYTMRKMLKFTWTGITSFSIVPLRLGIIIGVITSMIAFGEIIYAFFIKLVKHTAVPGWTSAVSVISFLFGIMFILIGLLGEYIGRILVEVRGRPRYLIAEELK